MKLGIIGTGNVGCAIALAAVARGSAREIVLVNRTRKTAEAVATDIRYGTPLSPKVDIKDGDYDALTGAGVVLITSGVNEKTGGATDRNDPRGRLRLLDKNARSSISRVVRATTPPARRASRRRRSTSSSPTLTTSFGTAVSLVRRRIARTRATSSRGENGLTR